MKKEENPPKDVSVETEKKENEESESSKETTDGTAPENKVQELTNLLQRLQAEFENYKKRIDKEKLDHYKFANADLIITILPILDSFELALRNNNEKTDFVKGVELIYSQFFEILEKQGLKQIDALNNKFDPHFHEVLLQQESDLEPNTVIEVLQNGYTFNERLIRTVKVKLSKKKQ
jgi:molecular chaperone GrpE